MLTGGKFPVRVVWPQQRRLISVGLGKAPGLCHDRFAFSASPTRRQMATTLRRASGPRHPALRLLRGPDGRRHPGARRRSEPRAVRADRGLPRSAGSGMGRAGLGVRGAGPLNPHSSCLPIHRNDPYQPDRERIPAMKEVDEKSADGSYGAGSWVAKAQVACRSHKRTRLDASVSGRSSHPSACDFYHNIADLI